MTAIGAVEKILSASKNKKRLMLVKQDKTYQVEPLHESKAIGDVLNTFSLRVALSLSQKKSSSEKREQDIKSTLSFNLFSKKIKK